MAAFFFIFMILMLGVRSSRDARAQIQNGFWFFKYLLLGLLVFGFFQITDRTLATRIFFIFSGWNPLLVDLKDFWGCWRIVAWLWSGEWGKGWVWLTENWTGFFITELETLSYENFEALTRLFFSVWPFSVPGLSFYWIHCQDNFLHNIFKFSNDVDWNDWSFCFYSYSTCIFFFNFFKISSLF